MELLNTNVQPTRRALWLQSLRQPAVWWRALKLGVATGLLQAAINQGDRWLNHSVDGAVIVKTVLSPLIGFTLVLVSSAVTWVHQTLERNSP